MKIVISGSIQHESLMEDVAGQLMAHGHEVVWPSVNDRGDAKVLDDDLKKKLIKDYFSKIDASDALLVINETKNGVDNYIGGNALIEMAHAFSRDIPIFLLNPIPEMNYTDEIRGMQPVLLGGNLELLNQYGGDK